MRAPPNQVSPKSMNDQPGDLAEVAQGLRQLLEQAPRIAIRSHRRGVICIICTVSVRAIKDITPSDTCGLGPAGLPLCLFRMLVCCCILHFASFALVPVLYFGWLGSIACSFSCSFGPFHILEALALDFSFLAASSAMRSVYALDCRTPAC